MNIQQRQSILTSIQNIDEINLDKALARLYPNESDATKIIFGDYNAAELIQLIRRVLSQLKTELQTGLGLLLPQSQNFNNDFGTINLESDISNIESYLVNEDFASVATSINKFIYYQIANGFWNKTISDVDVSSINIKKIEVELLVIQEKLKDAITNNDKLNVSIKSIKDELEDYLVEKKSEFESLKQNQTASNEGLQHINDSLNKAKDIKEELGELWSVQNGLAEEMNTKYQTHEHTYDELYSKLLGLSTDMETSLTKVNSTRDDIIESKTEIETRITEAKRLLGLSADAALVGKFTERKDQVASTLWKWRIAIVLSALGAVCWSVFVYSQLAISTTMPYLDLVVNLVRSSPGFVLMWYVMAQYNKERTIEEEYAFRAAISATINAYADLLAGHDGNDSKDASRQMMLLDAIKQVYSKPQIVMEHASKRMLEKSSKELHTVLKELAKK